MKLFRILPVLTVVALLTTTAEAALQIGGKAPAVKVAKWMTKEPASLPGGKDAGKHVFVVEFWATWYKPCWSSIPHLGELQKKYEKDGLIIIGISNEDPETIAKFIGSEKGGKKMEMPYYVGADDEMATNEAWAKDVEGIPYAIIVDKGGLVMWQGNPLDPVFDATLEKVIAGKYDLESAKKAEAVAKKAAEADKKVAELMPKLQAAYATHNAEQVFKLMEEWLQLKPQELRPYMVKRQFFVEFNKEDQIPAWNAKILEQFKDDPESLRGIIESELGREFAQRDAALLIRSTVRLIDVSKDFDAGALNLLARVQSACGMLDAAIETEAKAVAGATKEDREKYQKVLDYYKTMKRLAKELRPVPTTSKAE